MPDRDLSAKGSVVLKNFLNDLKRRRKNGRLTQTYMAEATGLSYQSINRLENNSFNDATVYNLLFYLEALEKHGIDTSIE